MLVIALLMLVTLLAGQFAALLAAIRALNLHPAPLTVASFAGIALQRKTLSGD